jgi:hypothetical protein
MISVNRSSACCARRASSARDVSRAVAAAAAILWSARRAELRSTIASLICLCVRVRCGVWRSSHSSPSLLLSFYVPPVFWARRPAFAVGRAPQCPLRHGSSPYITQRTHRRRPRSTSARRLCVPRVHGAPDLAFCHDDCGARGTPAPAAARAAPGPARPLREGGAGEAGPPQPGLARARGGRGPSGGEARRPAARRGRPRGTVMPTCSLRHLKLSESAFLESNGVP